MVMNWINAIGAIIAGISCIILICTACLGEMDSTLHEVFCIVAAVDIILVFTIDIVYYMLTVGV